MCARASRTARVYHTHRCQHHAGGPNQGHLSDELRVDIIPARERDIRPRRDSQVVRLARQDFVDLVAHLVLHDPVSNPARLPITMLDTVTTPTQTLMRILYVLAFNMQSRLSRIYAGC